MTSLGTAYAALCAGHDLGDHVVQTDWQAANKGAPEDRHGPREPRALAGHVLSYTATQAAALRAVGVPLWRGRTLAGLAFSAASHAFIDLRWPVRWVLEHTGSRDFAQGEFLVRDTFRDAARRFGETAASTVEAGTHKVPISGPYLADQALHHGCLLIAARIIAG